MPLWLAVVTAFGSGVIGAAVGVIGTVWLHSRQQRDTAIEDRKKELKNLYAEILASGLEAMRCYFSPKRAAELRAMMSGSAFERPMGQMDYQLYFGKQDELLRSAMTHQAYVDLLVEDQAVAELFGGYKNHVYLGIGEVEPDDYFRPGEELHNQLVEAMKQSVSSTALANWYKNRS